MFVHGNLSATGGSSTITANTLTVTGTTTSSSVVLSGSGNASLSNDGLGGTQIGNSNGGGTADKIIINPYVANAGQYLNNSQPGDYVIQGHGTGGSIRIGFNNGGNGALNISSSDLSITTAFGVVLDDGSGDIIVPASILLGASVGTTGKAQLNPPGAGANVVLNMPNTSGTLALAGASTRIGAVFGMSGTSAPINGNLQWFNPTGSGFSVDNTTGNVGIPTGSFIMSINLVFNNVDKSSGAILTPTFNNITNHTWPPAAFSGLPAVQIFPASGTSYANFSLSGFVTSPGGTTTTGVKFTLGPTGSGVNPNVTWGSLLFTQFP
jgi:hypothetical protein